MNTKEAFLQFGGARAMLMIGGTATQMGTDGHLWIRFKARAKNGANHVKISLAADDTYTVEFTAQRNWSNTLRRSETTKGKFEGIYADQLRELFERETGLYLSLGTMAGA